MSETITYREIAAYPGYLVGSDGTVWSSWIRTHALGRRGALGMMADRWFRMETCTTPKGYLSVLIKKNGGKKHGVFVHTLVLLAFSGSRPESCHGCRHLDGNKKNNRFSNLKWGTAQENCDDRTMHGATARGSRAGASKLTEDDVRAIDILLKTTTLSKAAIGRRFNVSGFTITCVLERRFWKHVKKEEDVQP